MLGLKRGQVPFFRQKRGRIHCTNHQLNCSRSSCSCLLILTQFAFLSLYGVSKKLVFNAKMTLIASNEVFACTKQALNPDQLTHTVKINLHH